MGLKVGQTTKFYDVRAKRKVNAKITKISKVGKVKSAHGMSRSGTKLRKFIK